MAHRRTHSRVSRTPSSSPDWKLHRQNSVGQVKLKRSKSERKRKQEHKHTESRKTHKHKHKGKDHHHHHRKSSSKKKTKRRSSRRKDLRVSNSDSSSSSDTSSEEETPSIRQGRSGSRSPCTKRNRENSHSCSRSLSNEKYREHNKRLRMSDKIGKQSQIDRHTNYSTEEDPKIVKRKTTRVKLMAQDSKVDEHKRIQDKLTSEDPKVEEPKQSEDILMEGSMVDTLQATNEEVAKTLSRDMEQARGSTGNVEADLEFQLRQKALANLMMHQKGSSKLNRSEVSSLSNTRLKDSNAGHDVGNHNTICKIICNAGIESDMHNNQPPLADVSCKYMACKAIENHRGTSDSIISKTNENEINENEYENDEVRIVLNSSSVEEKTANDSEGEPNLYGEVDHLMLSINAQRAEKVKENESEVTGIITTKNIHLQFDQASEPTQLSSEKPDSSLTEEPAQSVHGSNGDALTETHSKYTNCTSKTELAISQEHEDGSSEFQRKTMSVMRGGELVQVSYKVYIPKRAVELARRRLQR